MSLRSQIESLFDSESHHLGKKTVVTSKIEHEAAAEEYKGFPDIDRLATDREPQFVIDVNRDRITFNIKIQNSIRNCEGVLTTPRTIQSLPAGIPNEPKNPELVLTTDYQGLNQESILLVDDYNPPATTIQASKGDTLVIKTKESEADRVGPKTEASLRLPHQKVTIEVNTDDGIESKPIEVIPKLQLRNWGELEVYGSEKGRVLPTNTANDFADRYTESIREADTEKVSINKSEELMFIPEFEHEE